MSGGQQGRAEGELGAFDHAFGAIEKLVDTPAVPVIRHMKGRGLTAGPLCGSYNGSAQMAANASAVTCEACKKKLARRKR